MTVAAKVGGFGDRASNSVNVTAESSFTVYYGEQQRLGFSLLPRLFRSAAQEPTSRNQSRFERQLSSLFTSPSVVKGVTPPSAFQVLISGAGKMRPKSCKNRLTRDTERDKYTNTQTNKQNTMGPANGPENLKLAVSHVDPKSVILGTLPR
jgi:hypothetical protein